VFGESYAGHYVPATASAIFKGNQAKTGPVHINLQGVAVGNGLTAPEIQYKYYPEMAFNNSVRPLVPKVEYEAMRAAADVCVKAIQTCQNKQFGCVATFAACNLALVTPVQLTGINLYDVRQKCQHLPLCYDFSNVQKFLDQDSVRKALGVGDRKWASCNMLVNEMFRGDWMQHFQIVFPEMLAAGIRVLIYAGDEDFICNYMGNKAWTLAMDWPNKDAFNAAGDHSWMISGKSTPAGLARTANNFTFLQVHDAGHMVPMDQPDAALQMLETFLNNKPFY